MIFETQDQRQGQHWVDLSRILQMTLIDASDGSPLVGVKMG